MAAMHKIHRVPQADPRQVISWVGKNLRHSQHLLRKPLSKPHHEYYKKLEAQCSGPICTLMKAELRIHHKERYFSCIPDKHDVVINNHCKSWLKKRGRLEDPHVQSVERLCVRAQEWMKTKDLDIVF